jgi:hypothetical protein
MSDALDVRIEWLDAPGVTTPEHAATWARYEVWVAGRCVPYVEEGDGTLRRSVYGSLYPLAEWIASNWWILGYHIRPSGVETRYWTWSNVRSYPWLAQHNLRGAGDGMAWPNLTVVVEGPITQFAWTSEADYDRRPIRFVSNGVALARTDSVMEGFAQLVNHVLERLAEERLPKTHFAEEWEAIAHTSDEEQEFCRAAARLGLDPYSVSDQVADAVVDAATSLPPELVDDFFDSADAAMIAEGARWTQRAVVAANKASAKARESLLSLLPAVSHFPTLSGRDVETDFDARPWLTGYAMARGVRSELGVGELEQFDTSPWVGVSDLSGSSSGVQGVAAVNEGRCGLVLAGPHPGAAAKFGQARALGRVLARPEQRRFVLSQARGLDEKVAGAFAAELLAPAEGIRISLDAIGKRNDAAIEAVARHYRVSPLVVKHQYDNQIAKAEDKLAW